MIYRDSYLWVLSFSLASGIFGGLFFVVSMVPEQESRRLSAKDFEPPAEMAPDKRAQDDSASEEEMDVFHPIQWGYGEKNGPKHWAELSPDFALCGSGKEQSPVSLTKSVGFKPEKPISLKYSKAMYKLVNEGNAILMAAQKGQYIEFQRKEYELREIRFHTPGEHLIDEIPYEVELQLVHERDNGKKLIVAVVFAEDSTNKALEPIWSRFPEGIKEVSEDFSFDLGRVVPEKSRYYLYKGSLTTPPCSEGVDWVVLMDQQSVSPGQVDRLRHAMGFNARPVQELNDRTVKLSN